MYTALPCAMLRKITWKTRRLLKRMWKWFFFIQLTWKRVIHPSRPVLRQLDRKNVFPLKMTLLFRKLQKNTSRDMTKPTKWHLRPTKTQLTLGIRPVWSESSLFAWRKLGSLATHWAHSEDSDQTGHFVGLVMRQLKCPQHITWQNSIHLNRYW